MDIIVNRKRAIIQTQYHFLFNINRFRTKNNIRINKTSDNSGWNSQAKLLYTNEIIGAAYLKIYTHHACLINKIETPVGTLKKTALYKNICTEHARCR